MSDDTPTPPDSTPQDATSPQGSPPAATPRAGSSRWSWKKTAIAAAVAVGIAGAGGAVVWAAGTPDGHPARGDGPMPRAAGPMGGGTPLHGETVVKGEDGETFTRLIQTGEITAMTDDSVTARSEDGHTKTYAIDPDTVVRSVEVGGQALIIATQDGDTATADTVVDATEPRAGRGRGPDHHPRPDRGNR